MMFSHKTDEVETVEAGPRRYDIDGVMVDDDRALDTDADNDADADTTAEADNDLGDRLTNSDLGDSDRDPNLVGSVDSVDAVGSDDDDLVDDPDLNEARTDAVDTDVADGDADALTVDDDDLDDAEMSAEDAAIVTGNDESADGPFDGVVNASSPAVIDGAVVNDGTFADDGTGLHGDVDGDSADEADIVDAEVIDSEVDADATDDTDADGTVVASGFADGTNVDGEDLDSGVVDSADGDPDVLDGTGSNGYIDVVDATVVDGGVVDGTVADSADVDSGLVDDTVIGDVNATDGFVVVDEPADQDACATPDDQDIVIPATAVDDTAAGMTPGGTMRPGDATVPAADLVGADTTAVQDRWQQAQLGFIDDPHAASLAARELTAEVLESHIEALRRQLAALDAWQDETSPDTEVLRAAMQGYRALFTATVGES